MLFDVRRGVTDLLVHPGDPMTHSTIHSSLNPHGVIGEPLPAAYFPQAHTPDVGGLGRSSHLFRPYSREDTVSSHASRNRELENDVFRARFNASRPVSYDQHNIWSNGVWGSRIGSANGFANGNGNGNGRSPSQNRDCRNGKGRDEWDNATAKAFTSRPPSPKRGLFTTGTADAIAAANQLTENLNGLGLGFGAAADIPRSAAPPFNHTVSPPQNDSTLLPSFGNTPSLPGSNGTSSPATTQSRDLAVQDIERCMLALQSSLDKLLPQHMIPEQLRKELNSSRRSCDIAYEEVERLKAERDSLVRLSL